MNLSTPGDGSFETRLDDSLRPFQSEATSTILHEINTGNKRIRIELAAQAGGTTTLLAVILLFLRSSLKARILYLADRRVLVDQFLNRISGQTVGMGAEISKMCAIRNLQTASMPLSPGDSSGKSSILATTIQQLGQRLSNSAPTEARRLGEFDLIITQSTAFDTPSETRDQLFASTDSPILIVSTAPLVDYSGSHEEFQTVFRYSTSDAIADGFLRHSAADPKWTADTSDSSDTDTLHVLRKATILCVERDRFDAQSLAREVSSITFPSVEILDLSGSDTESVESALRGIRSGEIAIPIISPSSSRTPLAEPRSFDSITRRGVEVAPALITPCSYATEWLKFGLTDISNDSVRFALNLRARFDINFNQMTLSSFESLVRSVLVRVGFEISASSAVSDGPDLKLRYRNELGFYDPSVYLVQIKHRKRSSQTVRSVRELVDLVRHHEPPARGILVTNQPATSAAIDTLAQLQDKYQVELRILDGNALKGLLLANTDLLHEPWRQVP